MTDTAELAKRLYETWRAKQDMVRPITTSEGPSAWIDRGERGGRAGGHQPRPRWDLLDSVQQGVWRDVATVAGNVLAGAVGAR